MVVSSPYHSSYHSSWFFSWGFCGRSYALQKAPRPRQQPPAPARPGISLFTATFPNILCVFVSFVLSLLEATCTHTPAPARTAHTAPIAQIAPCSSWPMDRTSASPLSKDSWHFPSTQAIESRRNKWLVTHPVCLTKDLLQHSCQNCSFVYLSNLVQPCQTPSPDQFTVLQLARCKMIVTKNVLWKMFCEMCPLFVIWL